MKRVLQVFAEPLLYGGQESAIMNFYTAIDRSKYQFDFFTPFVAENHGMMQRISNMGGKVFYYNRPFESRLRKYYFTSELKRFITQHQYDIVHINSGSSYALAHGAKICKDAGVKKVIIHSHASGVDNLKHRLVRRLYDPYFLKYADYCVGCSRMVSEYRYPKEILNSEKNIVIYNGINTNLFHFSQCVRDRVRAELQLNDYFVLGSVGRLSREKNSLFIIEVFNELRRIHKKSKLLMIGDGELDQDVNDKLNEYHLQDDVIRLKNRNDVNQLMCAMDCFVLPSLYEGFGLVLVEAQAVGLPCICSEAVTNEVIFSDHVCRKTLQDPADSWAETVHSIAKDTIDRNKSLDNMSRYDLSISIKDLENIYER